VLGTSSAVDGRLAQQDVFLPLSSSDSWACYFVERRQNNHQSFQSFLVIYLSDSAQRGRFEFSCCVVLLLLSTFTTQLSPCSMSAQFTPCGPSFQQTVAICTASITEPAALAPIPGGPFPSFVAAANAAVAPAVTP
jgi:hypothetical protein